MFPPLGGDGLEEGGDPGHGDLCGDDGGREAPAPGVRSPRLCDNDWSVSVSAPGVQWAQYIVHCTARGYNCTNKVHPPTQSQATLIESNISLTMEKK